VVASIRKHIVVKILFKKNKCLNGRRTPTWCLTPEEAFLNAEAGQSVRLFLYTDLSPSETLSLDRLVHVDRICRKEDLVGFVVLTLKAALHHFLFLRNVYPSRWFRCERIFETYIKACRHQDVRDYISEAVNSVKVIKPPWRSSDRCGPTLHSLRRFWT
jgi:hypothetical protein